MWSGFLSISSNWCAVTLWLWFFSNVKIWRPCQYIEHDHTTRRKFSKNLWKKFLSQNFGFLKNPLSESGWWSTWLWFKNTYFWSENFFQRLLENFLRVVWSCSIYLEGCPRSYLYTRKKIRVIRHTYQKISTKTRFTSQKKTVQNDFPLYHCRPE